jgi:hypothetical protein
MKKYPHSGEPIPAFKTQHHRAIKQTPFWLVVCLILLTGCGRAPAATPEPTAAGASSVVISTFTPVPTDLPSSPEASMPTPEASPDAAATSQIPGLTPRNVTVTLEQNQFTCTLPVKGAVYYERTCTRGVPAVQVFQVVISGRAPGTVDFIEAFILQYENPENEIAIQILSLIAGLPYDGAAPDEARAWVESAVPALSGDTQETTLGGVKYVLYGPPTKLTLEMGELP